MFNGGLNSVNPRKGTKKERTGHSRNIIILNSNTEDHLKRIPQMANYIENKKFRAASEKQENNITA
jgi:hypothetical protein